MVEVPVIIEMLVIPPDSTCLDIKCQCRVVVQMGEFGASK